MSETFDQLQRHLRPEAILGAMVAVVVLTLLSAYLYVFKAPVTRYRALARSSSDATLERTLAAVTAGQAAIATAEPELEALRSRLYGGLSELPIEQMESSIIDRLDRISARHDVQLVGVSPEDMRRVITFDELPYEVEVSGSYFALFGWLRDVEEELRPLVIDEFQMNGVAESRLVKMKLRLVSYRPSREAP